MSWLYSQALVAEYSEVCSLDGVPCAPLKSTPMPQAYLSSDRMTAFSRLSRFGMTFEPLTESLGTELLTWYLRGFRASRSVMKESEISKPVNGTSGPKHAELFLKSELDTFCLKMCGGYVTTCPWSSVTCAELAIPSNDLPLPRREAPARYRSESAYGYLPACTARDGSGSGTDSSRRRGRGCRHGLNLRDWFRTFFNLVYPPVVIAEYMMGWPLGWTDLKPLGMVKFRQWLDSHGINY